MPEIRQQIEKGLGARQIYKLLHPIAMIDTPQTNHHLEKLLKDLIGKFSKNNYSGPHFLSQSAYPVLSYMIQFGSGFFDPHAKTENRVLNKPVLKRTSLQPSIIFETQLL